MALEGLTTGEGGLERTAIDQKANEALLVWTVFFFTGVVIHGTVPFLLGWDMTSWTYSPTKTLLASFVSYSLLFLGVPLLLTKGGETVLRPSFLVPLLVAMISISLWSFFRGIAAISILVIVYLHWRFDLSELGIRSRGYKGDIGAVLITLVLNLSLALFGQDTLYVLDLEFGLRMGLDRLFANPASSIESLFYFGFLAERLSQRFGGWKTILMVATMYALHEMRNPEYWYEGMMFGWVFVTVAVVTVIYLWRRSVTVIWLGDGAQKTIGALLSAA
ncbi:MAG: hypothetical protein ACW99U_06340 [Candidatus Thorarchaeota archaeon]|jgi:hypothetical protein